MGGCCKSIVSTIGKLPRLLSKASQSAVVPADHPGFAQDSYRIANIAHGVSLKPDAALFLKFCNGGLLVNKLTRPLIYLALDPFGDDYFVLFQLGGHGCVQFARGAFACASQQSRNEWSVHLLGFKSWRWDLLAQYPPMHFEQAPCWRQFAIQHDA